MTFQLLTVFLPCWGASRLCLSIDIDRRYFVDAKTKKEFFFYCVSVWLISNILKSISWIRARKEKEKNSQQ